MTNGYHLEYSGELSADGQSLVGKWSVYQLSLLGFKKTKVRSGDFRLDRIKQIESCDTHSYTGVRRDDTYTNS